MLSQISRSHIRFIFHYPHCFFKNSSPMLEILEHIETCARGSEQNGVPRLTQPESKFDRFFHSRSAMERSSVCQSRGDLLGCCADQDDMPATLPNERCEREVITTLVLSAEQDNDTLSKCFERFDGRIHICRLGVVVEFHTGDLSGEFQPVFDTRKSADRRTHRIGGGAACEAGAQGGHNVFQVMVTSQRNFVARD